MTALISLEESLSDVMVSIFFLVVVVYTTTNCKPRVHAHVWNGVDSPERDCDGDVLLRTLEPSVRICICGRWREAK